MQATDVSRWDVSNVSNFFSTFGYCEQFNSDVSQWNVGKSTDFTSMFCRCKAFNSDLSAWNMSKAIRIANMFSGAEAFNSDISNWNVSNVTNMSFMLRGAKVFNTSIEAWDTRKPSSFNMLRRINFQSTSRCMERFKHLVACLKKHNSIRTGSWTFNNVFKQMDFMFMDCSRFGQLAPAWMLATLKFVKCSRTTQC